MKQIVLASRNTHKVEEFNNMLEGYEILSLDEIGFEGDIEETGTTMEENSRIKSESVYNFLKEKGKDIAVIADDSGLCVDALNGAPGVYSARYAGSHDDEANRIKLLKELEGKSDRSAYMACVISYKDSQHEEIFVGKTFGEITTQKLGSDKFGYDSVFYSLPLKKTFGEASAEEKDSVSHRGEAVKLLKEFLKTL